ncbi:MAG: DPP IV N-terminal domain-containing protein, partial [Vicingaceae bacterium]
MTISTSLNARNIFLATALFIFTGAFAQQKELTLEDAVLSYSKGLTPKSISGLKWVDGSNNYIYKEKDQYIIKTALGEKIASFGLEKFKPTYPKLERLPRFNIINKTEMVFEYNKQMIHFNYNTGEEISKISFDANTQNKDYNIKAKALAYTFENNLYIIAKGLESGFAVTNNPNKNIVSGQAIHRYEFGISKGTFWSPNGN